VWVYDIFFSAGFHGIKGEVNHHSSWQVGWIQEDFIPPKVTATFDIFNHTPRHSKSPIELIIWLLPSFIHIQCRRMDLCWRLSIWLQEVGSLAHNHTQMTMWEHQIIMLEEHRAKTLNSDNPRINYIHPHHHQGIVTHLRSHHLQALPSSTTRLHSIWHQAHNQALVQPENIRVMGHRGKDMISPKEVMADLKCSPLNNLQDMGPHRQEHLECFQHRLETFQSFSWPLPLPLIQDNSPVQLVDPPLASGQNDFGRRQKHGWQMLPWLPICPHCPRFPMMKAMQIMRATIRRTWAGPKAKPLSAWCERNSPWSTVPKDGAAQLKYVQQVEESIGGRVSWETAWVDYPGMELSETAARKTPALGDSCCRFFGDLQDVAACGKFR